MSSNAQNRHLNLSLTRHGAGLEETQRVFDAVKFGPGRL